MIETQAKQDSIEQKVVDRVAFVPLDRQEPSSKCCGLPYARERAFFSCLGCKTVVFESTLRAMGIDPSLIG